MLTLVLSGSGFGNSKLASKGNLKPVPNTNAVPEFKVLSFSSASSVTFVLIFFTMSKSLGWNILNTKKLEHWLSAVADNSLGLCVINVKIVPYFLPSLVILSNIL